MHASCSKTSERAQWACAKTRKLVRAHLAQRRHVYTRAQQQRSRYTAHARQSLTLLLLLSYNFLDNKCSFALYLNVPCSKRFSLFCFCTGHLSHCALMRSLRRVYAPLCVPIVLPHYDYSPRACERVFFALMSIFARTYEQAIITSAPIVQ